MANKKHMTMDEKLNSIRAGVLGSNDGILTVVGVMFSVSAASGSAFALFIAALSNLISGAFSGEYASVSSQSDSEKVVVEREKQLLKTDFEGQQRDVTDFYIQKGISQATAAQISRELLAKKPLETVLSVKYDITLGHYMNPWQAAYSSLICFTIGGLFPLLAMIFIKGPYQFPITIASTTVALAFTGLISSKLSNGFVKKAIWRNIIIGIITIFIHYGLGKIFS